MSEGDPIWAEEKPNPLAFASESFKVTLAQYTEKARFLAVAIKALSPKELEMWRAWLGSGDAGQYTNILHQVTVLAG